MQRMTKLDPPAPKPPAAEDHSEMLDDDSIPFAWIAILAPTLLAVHAAVSLLA